jgi:hypothetical protein
MTYSTRAITSTRSIARTSNIQEVPSQNQQQPTQQLDPLFIVSLVGVMVACTISAFFE